MAKTLCLQICSQFGDGSPLRYERTAKLVSEVMFWHLAAAKFIDVMVFMHAFFPLFFVLSLFLKYYFFFRPHSEVDPNE